MTEPAGLEWTPEFPGQRPPFRPGHELRLTAGHRSERRVGARAAEITEALLADPDVPAHLREPMFAAAVGAWAHAEAACQMLREWIDGQDIIAGLTAETTAEEEETHTKRKITRKGSTRTIPSVLEVLRRYETHAANLRSRLGLDPSSAAKVGRDLAIARRLDVDATPLAEALAEIQRRRELTAGSGNG